VLRVVGTTGNDDIKISLGPKGSDEVRIDINDSGAI